MKDEIKEILSKMERLIVYGQYNAYYDLEKQLLDYITNLQQYYKDNVNKYEELIVKYSNLQEENQRLKELVNPTTQIFIDTQDMEERYGQELYEDYLKKQLEDCKSRIKKAIEYNYELQERYCHSALFDEPVASKIYEISEKQLNILQGVGKDE